MYLQPHFRFERLPVVLIRCGWGKSTLYKRIQEGLFPPPVSLGGRTKGWPSHEIDEVLSALLRGSKTDDLRALVSQLTNKRTET